MHDPEQGELERRIEALQEQLAVWERRRANAWHRRLGRWLKRPRNVGALALAVVLIPLTAWAVTIPFAFVNGTVADADEVNANFAALADAINLHEPDPSAHHVKTTDAAELSAGLLPDARLSPNVSLLGAGIAEAELEFDPATQVELDGHLGVFGAHALDPAAHHLRYTDAEALAAAGPHVTSLEGLAGGTVAGDTNVEGLLATSVGVQFPDATTQTTAYAPGASAVIPNRILVSSSGGDFDSIQEAIDSVTPTASDPYRIDIAPGVYKEDLVLKSHLELRGAGIDGTVIANVAPDGTQVSALGAMDVKISGLTIVDDPGAAPASTMGVFVDASSSVELHDVRIEGAYFDAAVVVSGGKLHARRAAISSLTERAVWLRFGADASIDESTLGSTECAVEAHHSDLSLTQSLVSKGSVCGAGGDSSQASKLLVSQNRFSRIEIREAASASIVGNDIENDVATAVVIDADPMTPSQIVGNRIRQTATIDAVALVGGGALVVGNSIWSAGKAISLPSGGDDWVILGNTLRAESETTIGGLGQPTIVGNHLRGGSDQIAVQDGIIMGNKLLPNSSATSTDRWQAAKDLAIDASNDAHLGYGHSFDLTGPSGALVFDASAGASLDVDAQPLTITAGGSSVSMGADGSVSIVAAGNLDLTGANVTISATGTLDLSGADVTTAATDALDLSANAVTVDASSKADIKGGTGIGLQSNGEIDVSSAATVDVNGALITLN